MFTSIRHFRAPKTFTFTTRLGAKPFLRKLNEFYLRKNKKSFSYRFETEAWGNSEKEYWNKIRFPQAPFRLNFRHLELHI